MRGFFSVMMLLLSLLVGFQQAIIVMHFKFHQKKIEQALCINKNRPELGCHGSCFLRKQWKEVETKDSPSTTTYPRVDMLLMFPIACELKDLEVVIETILPVYKERNYVEPYREIIVPPPIVC